MVAEILIPKDKQFTNGTIRLPINLIRLVGFGLNII